MARREEVFNSSILAAGSMGGNLESTAKELVNGPFSVQANWSSGSTPVGVLTLQASLDGTTYSDISTANVSGNSGSAMWNVEQPAYKYMKVTYTRTSGSATLNILARILS